MYGRLLLYLAMLGIGILFGSRKISNAIPSSMLQKFQTGALIILLFTMGLNIGGDDRVLQSLKMIGLSATLITIFSIFFSVLGVYVVRRLLRINKMGEKEND